MSENKAGEKFNPLAEWLRFWTDKGESAGGTTGGEAGREVMRLWQETIRRMIEETLHSESFVASIGEALRLGNRTASSIGKLVEQQLRKMGLPDADELKKLRARVRKLDDQVEDLTELVEELALRLESRGGPEAGGGGEGEHGREG